MERARVPRYRRQAKELATHLLSGGLFLIQLVLHQIWRLRVDHQTLKITRTNTSQTFYHLPNALRSYRKRQGDNTDTDTKDAATAAHQHHHLRRQRRQAIVTRVISAVGAVIIRVAKATTSSSTVTKVPP